MYNTTKTIIIITKEYSRSGMTQTLKASIIDGDVKAWRELESSMKKFGKVETCGSLNIENYLKVKAKGYGLDYAELLAQNLREKGYSVKRVF